MIEVKIVYDAGSGKLEVSGNAPPILLNLVLDLAKQATTKRAAADLGVGAAGRVQVPPPELVRELARG